MNKANLFDDINSLCKTIEPLYNTQVEECNVDGCDDCFCYIKEIYDMAINIREKYKVIIIKKEV